MSVEGATAAAVSVWLFDELFLVPRPTPRPIAKPITTATAQQMAMMLLSEQVLVPFILQLYGVFQSANEHGQENIVSRMIGRLAWYYSLIAFRNG